MKPFTIIAIAFIVFALLFAFIVWEEKRFNGDCKSRCAVDDRSSFVESGRSFRACRCVDANGQIFVPRPVAP